MILDITKLNATVAVAKAKAPANWSAKIERAASMLLDNPYIHDTGNGLLILSETSGETYLARPDGKCGCKARKFGQVCKHRLAVRLMTLYHERAN